MVIFHSYVSLPEGNQCKLGKGVYILSKTLAWHQQTPQTWCNEQNPRPVLIIAMSVAYHRYSLRYPEVVPSQTVHPKSAESRRDTATKQQRLSKRMLAYHILTGPNCILPTSVLLLMLHSWEIASATRTWWLLGVSCLWIASRLHCLAEEMMWNNDLSATTFSGSNTIGCKQQAVYFFVQSDIGKNSFEESLLKCQSKPVFQSLLDHCNRNLRSNVLTLFKLI